MRNFLLPTFCLTLLAACGAPAQEDDYGDDFWSLDEGDSTQSNWKARMQESVLECGIEGGCPDNVGLLVSYSDNPFEGAGLGVCTASLVGSDLILTNAHCIPSDLRREFEDTKKSVPCGDKLFFRDSGSFSSYCSELVWSSFDSGVKRQDGLDLALVRLKTPNNQASVLKISREGIPDAQKLNWIRMSPLKGDQVKGRLLKGQCESFMGSVFHPDYTRADYPLIGLLNCAAIGGNSGSPLLNSQGEISTVLQSTLSDEAKILYEQFSFDYLPHAALGSSMSCMAEDWQKRGPLTEGICGQPVARGFDLESLTVAIDKELDSPSEEVLSFFESLEKRIEQLQKSTPGIVWKVRKSSGTRAARRMMGFEIAPSCYQGDRKQILKQVAKSSESLPLAEGLLRFHYGVGLNDRYKAEPRVKAEADAAPELAFLGETSQQEIWVNFQIGPQPEYLQLFPCQESK